jgi:hypothetical protein
MSKNKKKLNIGINKAIDRVKIWKFVLRMFDKLLTDINPPADTVVRARLKESKKRISTIL